MRNRFVRAALRALGYAAVVMLLGTCATNPVTHKAEFMLLSAADESALGKETDPQIIDQYGVYDDAELTASVDALGRRLGAVSHRPELAYSVKVLDSAVVNAFAVPGGYVYLTRGILAYLNDEAELAGVMGHEVGHIAARHSAQAYSRAQAAQLGLGLGSVLSPTIAKLSGVAQAGIQLLFLSFSRDNERQADDLGVLYSSKTGYDAAKMANLFVTLERLSPSDGANGLPAFFSTHPNPPDRIEAIRKAASAWQAKNAKAAVAVNRDRYLAMLDGIVFGDDPRQGYVSGQVFYHPQMRFQLPVPAGWTLTNTPQQVQMLPESKQAAIQLSLAEEKTPAAAADAFVSGTGAAVVSSDSTPVGGFPARRLLCDVTTEDGVLRALVAFVQKDAVVYALLGYSARDRFESWQEPIEKTLAGFRALTDRARIAVTPDRIALRKAARQGTLQQALQALGVDADALAAHAILNGMELKDQVAAGTTLKVVLAGTR